MRGLLIAVLCSLALGCSTEDTGAARRSDASADEDASGDDTPAAEAGSDANGQPGADATVPSQDTTLPSPGSGNFDERCSGPAVLACFGFDTADDTDPYLNDSGFSAPAFDASTAAEGTGSIRMRVEPGSPADTSGSFSVDFPPGIGPGESLYIQWRQRFSQAFIESRFNGNGFKQVVVHENTSTAGCSDSEVVVTSRYDQLIATVYHACGIFHGARENPVDGDIYEHNYQPGGDNRCLYSWLNNGAVDYLEPTADLAETACVGYLAEQWLTFQLAIHLASWCTLGSYADCPQDSRLQLWATYEGQEPVLAIDWPYALRTTTDPDETRYDSAQFTPYNTDKDTTVDHAVGELWYDSVIVSRERIPEPE